MCSWLASFIVESVREHQERAFQDPGGRRQRPHTHFLQSRQRGLATKTGWVTGNTFTQLLEHYWIAHDSRNPISLPVLLELLFFQNSIKSASIDWKCTEAKKTCACRSVCEWVKGEWTCVVRCVHAQHETSKDTSTLIYYECGLEIRPTHVNYWSRGIFIHSHVLILTLKLISHTYTTQNSS